MLSQESVCVLKGLCHVMIGVCTSNAFHDADGNVELYREVLEKDNVYQKTLVAMKELERENDV